MADNTTQVSEQINSAVNSALGVGALAAIYTGNFVSFGEEGGALALIAKTITENGVYRAADDGADGYNVVTVETPTGIKILAGEEEPTTDIGENGQLYLKLVEPPINWICDSDYLVTSVEQRLDTQDGQDFYKTVEGAAIAVEAYDGFYYGPALISTVADYVKYTRNTSSTYSADIDGVTWYLSTTDNWGTRHDDPTVPTLRTVSINQGNAETVIRLMMETANVSYTEGEFVVNSVLYKKNNTWYDIYGADINDITLGGE